MSLDITIIPNEDTEEAWYGNITHNLAKMAMECGLYEVMWEAAGKTTKEVLPKLEAGLMKLVLQPEVYEEFNPANGWGSYETLVMYAIEYLKACRTISGKIAVSR